MGFALVDRWERSHHNTPKAMRLDDMATFCEDWLILAGDC